VRSYNKSYPSSTFDPRYLAKQYETWTEQQRVDHFSKLTQKERDLMLEVLGKRNLERDFFPGEFVLLVAGSAVQKTDGSDRAFILRMMSSGTVVASVGFTRYVWLHKQHELVKASKDKLVTPIS
jgi:hypothetical protein